MVRNLTAYNSPSVADLISYTKESLFLILEGKCYAEKNN